MDLSKANIVRTVKLLNIRIQLTERKCFLLHQMQSSLTLLYK